MRRALLIAALFASGCSVQYSRQKALDNFARASGSSSATGSGSTSSGSSSGSTSSSSSSTGSGSSGSTGTSSSSSATTGSSSASSSSGTTSSGSTGGCVPVALSATPIVSNLNTPYALAPATIGNRFELLLGLGAGGEVLAPYGGTPPLQLAGVPLAGNNLAYTDVDGAGRRLLLSWDILTVAGAWIFDDGGLADAGTTQPFNGANQIGAVVPGPFGDDGGTLIFVGELGASEWRFLDPAQGLAQRGIVTLANSADGIFAAAGDPAHRQLVVMGGDANGNPQLIAVVVDPTPHDVLLAGYGAINNADYPQLQLVDVNGDGVGDLVAAFPQEGEVDIRDGYPDGGFDQSAVSIVAPNALNGAGLAFVPLFGTPAFPDLVYAPLSGADSNLYLFPNGGDGRFLAGDGGQLCVTPVPAGSLVGLAAGDAGFFVLDGDSLAAYHP